MFAARELVGFQGASPQQRRRLSSFFAIFDGGKGDLTGKKLGNLIFDDFWYLLVAWNGCNRASPGAPEVLHATPAHGGALHCHLERH